MYIRKNVWTIENDPADHTLIWYGRALGGMKSLPIDDHRSLRWQAAVHAYDRTRDPLRTPGDQLPSTLDQSRYWTQCQHGSWFFLPWHRMYLYHYEQIVRSFVVSLGGPDDWALPYWNYSDGVNSRLLPPSFRNEFLGDGTINHLYVANRDPRANNGNTFADQIDTDLECLKDQDFTDMPVGRLAGFGGPVTGFMHSGSAMGTLERTPHGSMHVAVGGWLGRFNTAGLDPMFWLHHSNIDRLWVVWLQRNSMHTNPQTASWLRNEAFTFKDVNGVDSTMYCEQVLETTQLPLEYQYEDISDPIPVTMGATPSATMISKLPQLITASARPVEVSHASFVTNTSLHIAMVPDTNNLEAFGVSDEPQHVYLHLENVTCPTYARAIDVYFGLPEGADPLQNQDYRIARMPLFGIDEASRSDGPHAGSGLNYSFEITEQWLDTGFREDANGYLIPLSFVPVGGEEESDVRIGRISIYAD